MSTVGIIAIGIVCFLAGFLYAALLMRYRKLRRLGYFKKPRSVKKIYI